MSIQNQIHDTLPKLLIYNAQKYGHRHIAISEKDYGIWQSYSWADYLKEVKEFALGLASLGFTRGDKLAIIGDNRPQLYWALVAAQALGGIPVPLYQDSIAEELRYVVDHSDSTVVVAEDQEQVDKILEMKEKLPKVKWVIYDDPRGLRNYKLPFLLSFVKVQEMGRELEKKDPGLFEREVERGMGDEVAIIPYTSGTTALPKGVVLTHHNLILSGLNFLKTNPWSESDRVMAYLPMAWIGDTFFSVVLSFLSGAQVNCPEEVTTVQKDLREIGPTFTFAPPRIWENMVTQVQVRLEDSDWLKRKLSNFFIPLGMKVAEKEIKGEQIPWYLKVLHKIGDWLVYGMLRDHLGLRHMRWALTGGAALGPEVFLFFRGLGVNLKQGYGLTESSAVAAVHKDVLVKLDSVGPPIAGVEVKISEEGEVLIKGPGIFGGYYKNPEATAESLKEGWLATGDAGFFDPDGHLVIIDRAKDVSRLLNGSVFAPQYLENKLKFSPYIREAVAIGEKRPFVTAMINIDMSSVGNWAERRAIPYTGYPDLSQKPEVYDLIHNEIVKVNQTLSPELRIKRYVVLHKELDPDDAEITRTRKLRRRFIAQKYANIIEALYGNVHQVGVKALITYEDGRTTEVERILSIREVGETMVQVGGPK
jgi:long-chain acyl-CoA synthetase